jgi:hypothetical protein
LKIRILIQIIAVFPLKKYEFVLRCVLFSSLCTGYLELAVPPGKGLIEAPAAASSNCIFAKDENLRIYLIIES